MTDIRVLPYQPSPDDEKELVIRVSIEWDSTEQEPKDPVTTLSPRWGISNEQDFIYLIQGGDLVKIGHAMNPFWKLRELRTGSPEELRLIGFFPGGRSIENKIHFDLQHAHSHGEWFYLYVDQTGVMIELMNKCFDFAVRNPVNKDASYMSRRIVWD